MPCKDSSSRISIRLDNNERVVSFEFAKITCGREITAQTRYHKYCQGKTLDDILAFEYIPTLRQLDITEEEQQFVFYLEWDALRSAIAEYLGRDMVGVDRERCKITSIAYDTNGVEINEVILPPKELPAILPCGYSNN